SDPDMRRKVDEDCASIRAQSHFRFRQDMFSGGPWRLGSLVPEISDLSLVTDGELTYGVPLADIFADPEQDLFKAVGGVVNIRKSCDVLRRGSMRMHRVGTALGKDLIVFSRFTGPSDVSKGHEILVLVNLAGHDIRLNSFLRGKDVPAFHRRVYRNMLEKG